MHIEERLESIDLTLKAILVAIQSGAQINAMATAEFVGGTAANDGPETAENKRKRRTKAEIEADNAAAAAAAAAQTTLPVLPGDPPGTRYWISEELGAVFVEQPGVGSPSDQSFKIQTAELFTQKKAEFEAKKAASTAAASSAGAATQGAAAAASTGGSTGDVTWDQAVGALKALAGNPAHGNEAVLKVVKSIDPNAANVPALKDKGKNAEILAACNALLNPVAAGADPLFG